MVSRKTIGAVKKSNIKSIVFSIQVKEFSGFYVSSWSVGPRKHSGDPLAPCHAAEGLVLLLVPSCGGDGGGGTVRPHLSGFLLSHWECFSCLKEDEDGQLPRRRALQRKALTILERAPSRIRARGSGLVFSHCCFLIENEGALFICDPPPRCLESGLTFSQWHHFSLIG